MARPAVALGAAVLLALAGCSGLGGQPTDTLTPAPVPGDADAAGDVEYPPGVGPGGVEDPLALAEAHHDALYREPHAVRRARTDRLPNGTLYRRRILEGQFSGDRSRFAVTLSTAGPGAGLVPSPPTRERLWTDGEVLAHHLEVGNVSSQELLPAGAFSRQPGPFDRGPEDVLGRPGPAREAGHLFRAVAVDVRRTESGTFVARGDRLVRPRALASLDDVTAPRNVSLSATLTAAGLVRSYRLRYEARVDGHRVRVARSVQYARVGELTVERPAWVVALLERRNASDDG